MRSWVGKLKSEQTRKRKAGDSHLTVTKLPSSKRGRPLMLGERLDSEVQSYIKALQNEGGVVTTPVVLAIATAVVESSDRTQLAKYGGPINITSHWAKSLLSRMKFVKRRGGSTKKILVSNFDDVKEQYLLDIAAVITMLDIPPASMINWDQTGLHIVLIWDGTVRLFGSCCW